MQGARVPLLVKELRSHMPNGISSVQSRMANHSSTLVLPWDPINSTKRPNGMAKIKKNKKTGELMYLFPWSEFLSETRWINCLYMSLVGRTNQDIWVKANIFFAFFFFFLSFWEVFFFFSFLKFIFSCAGSSLLCGPFSSCGDQEPLFIEVSGLLTAVACFISEHSL